MTLILTKARPRAANRVVEAAEEFQPDYSDTFYESLLAVSERLSEEFLTRMLEVSRTEREIFNYVNGAGKLLQELDERDYDELLRDNIRAGGVVGAVNVNNIQPVSKAEPTAAFSFDVTNVHATNYARDRSAKLVRNISRQMRDVIRQSLVEGTEGALTSRDIARNIKEYIPLTGQQAKALSGFRRQLESQATLGLTPPDQRRLSATESARVRRIMRDGGTQDAIDDMVETYRNRLARKRANDISRTETTNNAAAGQRTSWLQARDEGILDPDRTRRFWSHTGDTKVRDEHRAIPNMNPEGVGLEEMFSTPDGPVAGAPHGTNCRCAEVLRTIDLPEELDFSPPRPAPPPRGRRTRPLQMDVLARPVTANDLLAETRRVAQEAMDAVQPPPGASAAEIKKLRENAAKKARAALRRARKKAGISEGVDIPNLPDDSTNITPGFGGPRTSPPPTAPPPSPPPTTVAPPEPPPPPVRPAALKPPPTAPAPPPAAMSEKLIDTTLDKRTIAGQRDRTVSGYEAFQKETQERMVRKGPRVSDSYLKVVRTAVSRIPESVNGLMQKPVSITASRDVGRGYKGVFKHVREPVQGDFGKVEIASKTKALTDFDVASDIRATTYHEYSHALDYQLGDPRGVGRAGRFWSQSKEADEFIAIFEKEYNELPENYRRAVSYFHSNRQEMFAETLASILSEQEDQDAFGWTFAGASYDDNSIFSKSRAYLRQVMNSKIKQNRDLLNAKGVR